MNILNKTACLSLLAITTACAPSGYYDSNGYYHSYGQSDTYRNEHAMSNSPVYQTDSGHTVVIYDRRGYYDYAGNYIDEDSAPDIGDEFFPPRGKCRIWFEGIAPEDQPAPISCRKVHDVPEGAYVIYGG